MFKIIDRIPLLPLAVAAVFMALAPFSPEPHLLEKSRMLFNGELTRGIDIFDFFWHSFLLVLLAMRLWPYKFRR
ncbi:MAG: RND transporter [Gammaproteobacteria bacterium]|nr:RND transporter [Gammaproteobacteria bacterium]